MTTLIFNVLNLPLRTSLPHLHSLASAMIRSLCLRQSRLVPLKSSISLSVASCFTRCPPSKAASFEHSSLLVRAASSLPKATPPPTPKAAPQAVTKKSNGVASMEFKRQLIHDCSLTWKPAPRLIVYHAGMPRIFVLGTLKLTTVFVFGFFAVVTIPSYIQTGAPLWQTAGCAYPNAHLSWAPSHVPS